MARNSQQLIGVDIGGTGVKAGIVDLSTGQLEGTRVRIETPQPATPTAVTEAVALLVQELEDRNSAPGLEAPVGVTFPGIVHHGVARSAANVHSSWIGMDIKALFTQRLGRPVAVLNDADAAGLAEVRYGSGRGIDGTTLMITLGTGIGSAYIFDSKLIPNAELGHLQVGGSRAETRVSATARERDELNWQEYSLLLQRYLSHVEFLFSPELFIVGGGISERADEYLPLLNLATPIVTATLGNDAGIVGAALETALHHELAF